MTRDELMERAADEAVHELSWESIEWLFKPLSVLDLLLRIDFEGMKTKIYEWCSDRSPSAMPHRFRGPYIAQLLTAIRVEEFYRAIKKARATVP